MDSVSLAVQIPGLFVSCIECLRCVQLGREFETDFELAICKLRAIELRLTRWGALMGIKGPESIPRNGAFDKGEAEKMYLWLEAIRREFDRAMETSEQYRMINDSNADRLQPVDTESKLQSGKESLQTLYAKMCIISNVRVKIRSRISWVLYRRGSFLNLIDGISDLTDRLMETFPTDNKENQRALCESEIDEIDRDGLGLLSNAIGDRDQILKDVIETHLADDAELTAAYQVIRNNIRDYGDDVETIERARAVISRNTRHGVYNTEQHHRLMFEIMSNAHVGLMENVHRRV